jgi:hypothetical protein
MTAAARLQKHRHKLREQHCRRLEVWVATGLIEAARLIAKDQGQPAWEFGQDALTAHMTRHPALLKTAYASHFKPSTS